MPRVVREIKFQAENGPRPEAVKPDFALKRQVVELFEYFDSLGRPMRKHTKPGQVCYEPFSGSGSQLIAGEQEGRRVFAMEISPAFVDVAVRRWQRFTGEVATRFDAGGMEQAGIECDAALGSGV